MSWPVIDELTEEYGNVRIRIMYDQDPLNPLTDWDSLTTIRGWHRRMTIGHGPDIRSDNYESFGHMLASVVAEEASPVVMLAPLYWYEHSGVSCKMGVPISADALAKLNNMDEVAIAFDNGDLAAFRSACMDDAGWDSGVAGLVYVTAKSQDDAGTPDKLLGKVARQEVEVYRQYLAGECYGYVVEELTTCDHGDQHAETLDSCFGMYGDVDEYVMEQARGFVGSSVIPWLRIS